VGFRSNARKFGRRTEALFLALSPLRGPAFVHRPGSLLEVLGLEAADLPIYGHPEALLGAAMPCRFDRTPGSARTAIGGWAAKRPARSAAAAWSSDDTITTALAAAGEATAAEVASVLGMGQSTVAKCLAAPRRRRGGPAPSGWPGERDPGGRPLIGPGRPSGRRKHSHGRDCRSRAGRPSAAGERLGRGALRTGARLLAAHPYEDLGPTHLGKALGRSQGAVSNLCGSSLSSATVEDVADAVGISTSHASKALASLARGVGVPLARGPQGGRQQADRWSAAAVEEHGFSGNVRLGRRQL
jgi:hypothetical protein